MISRERLRRSAEACGVCLDELALERLDIYARLLVEWNQRYNLTAITTPEDIENKHFIDCLVLAEKLGAIDDLVDVGTGAGFPGLVAKIYRPSLPVTLMEPNEKRLKFLQHVSAELDLEVSMLKERGEEAARKQWREQWHAATARAVAPLRMLCEYCLPLLCVGGSFVAMKGMAGDEVAEAKGAVAKLGGELQRVLEYRLPQGESRSLVFIEKVAPTPPGYPRNGGVIRKRPL